MKKATIVFEYENEKCDCYISDSKIPISSLYQMVCKLKEELENLIAQEAEELGIYSQEGFNEFMDAKFDFEQAKLNT